MVLTSHADADARALAADATRTLIAWAAGVQAQDIPDAVLRRAALVLSDNLAATVAAEAEPEVQAAQAKLTERSIAQEATVFNRAAARVDRYAAAAANGTAATWCELDEGYRLAPAHAGVYILPALLAEAEATGADTLQVLRALTLGYEIVGRCAQAFPFAAMTVHPHAAFGTLGAAAGIGLLAPPGRRHAARHRLGRRQHGVCRALQSRARRRAGTQSVDRCLGLGRDARRRSRAARARRHRRKPLRCLCRLLSGRAWILRS